MFLIVTHDSAVRRFSQAHSFTLSMVMWSMVINKPQSTRVEGASIVMKSWEVLVHHGSCKANSTDLLEIHFAEPEALEHSRDRTARIFGSDLEDAVLQRGLLELPLSFFANFAFEVRVWTRKKAGVT